MSENNKDNILLHYCSDEDISLINQIAYKKVFPAQSTIIKNNDRNRDMFYLQSGQVSIRIIDAHGNDIEVSQLDAGALFGEMNFIIPTRRTASVITLTEVEVIVYPYHEFTSLLKSHYDIAAKVFAAINIALSNKLHNTISTIK